MLRPRLYVCGHLHVPQKRALKDGRVVANLGYTCKGDYRVFRIDPEHLDFERRRLSAGHDEQ